MGCKCSKNVVGIAPKNNLSVSQNEELTKLTQEAHDRLANTKTNIQHFGVDKKVLKLPQDEINAIKRSLLKFYRKASTISLRKMTYRRLMIILETHSKKLLNKLVVEFYIKFQNTELNDTSLQDDKKAYLNILRSLFELFLYMSYIKCIELLVQHNIKEIEKLRNENNIKYKQDPIWRKNLADSEDFDEFLRLAYDQKMIKYIKFNNSNPPLPPHFRTKSKNKSMSFQTVDLRSVNNSFVSYDVN